MKYETVKHRGRTLRIPVDDDGYVPQDALLGRFEEWADKRDHIQADGSTRHDPRQSSRGWKDYTHRSETVLPAKVTPKQAALWWHNPGNCDIEGIDTPGRPKRNTQGHGTKAQRAALAKIPVTAIELEEATVRRNLLQSFTNDELTRLGKARVKIHVYPRTHTAVGTYESRRNLVTVDRKHSIPQTTITHEVVHALRDKDRSRRGILAKSNIPGIEESLTVAEQEARNDSPGFSGYYWDITVFDEKTRRWRGPTNKEAKRMAEEDHKLFTGGRGKGLRGAAAMESVSSNWSKSHIARLSYKSKGKMAVNQATGIYLGIEPVSKAQPRTSKKKAAGGVSVPVSRPTAVAAEKRVPKRVKGQKTVKRTSKLASNKTSKPKVMRTAR
jgi:hypothetical protein